MLEQALADLPPRQRQVVLLRDVEDVNPADLCNILELTETNQRVLLHRGRARIRKALDEFVREGGRVTANDRAGARQAKPAAQRSPSGGPTVARRRGS